MRRNNDLFYGLPTTAKEPKLEKTLTKQIHITNNTTKTTNYFHVFHTKLCFIIYKKHTFFLPYFLIKKHTYAVQIHSPVHMQIKHTHRNLSVLPCDFINKVVLQLKRMTFLSMEVVT